MEEAWGHGDQVQVVHPGAACIAGRDLVRANVCASMNRPSSDAFVTRKPNMPLTERTSMMYVCPEMHSNSAATMHAEWRASMLAMRTARSWRAGPPSCVE